MGLYTNSDTKYHGKMVDKKSHLKDGVDNWLYYIELLQNRNRHKK